MKTRKNTRLAREYEKYECDRCGLQKLKRDLIKQDGLLVCQKCVDEKGVGEVD